MRGVDLEVREGEIFGFLGPNGAGKTTTMRILTTLMPASGGTATVCGLDLRRDPGQGPSADRLCQPGWRRGTHGDWPREPAVAGARLWHERQRGAAARNRTDARLDMDDFADRLVKTYSGGQKRRLDVALGIMHHPRLLFLDEPTTGLDPQSRARIWDEVRALTTRA